MTVSIVVERLELGRHAVTYHLRHSRHRVPDPPGRVARPRHLLVMRRLPQRLEILRVLHDAMEFDRHVPPEG